jgi:hypothetical protein
MKDVTCVCVYARAHTHTHTGTKNTGTIHTCDHDFPVFAENGTNSFVHFWEGHAHVHIFLYARISAYP